MLIIDYFKKVVNTGFVGAMKCTKENYKTNVAKERNIRVAAEVMNIENVVVVLGIENVVVVLGIMIFAVELNIEVALAMNLNITTVMLYMNIIALVSNIVMITKSLKKSFVLIVTKTISNE